MFGIVVSQVIGAFLALIPNTYFSARLVGYSFFDQIKDVVKPLFAALVAGFCSWFMVQQSEGNLFLWFAGGALVGAGSYLAMSFVVRAEGAFIIFTKAKTMKKNQKKSL